MTKSSWPFPSLNVEKKVVNFKDPIKIVVGESAIVFPVNHPDKNNVSNTRHVYTSSVVKVNEDGSFETLNTIYKPL